MLKEYTEILEKKLLEYQDSNSFVKTKKLSFTFDSEVALLKELIEAANRMLGREKKMWEYKSRRAQEAKRHSEYAKTTPIIHRMGIKALSRTRCGQIVTWNTLVTETEEPTCKTCRRIN